LIYCIFVLFPDKSDILCPFQPGDTRVFVAEFYSESGILLFPPTLNTLLRSGCHTKITCHLNDEHQTASSFKSALATRWKIDHDRVSLKTQLPSKPADTDDKIPWYTVAKIVSYPHEADAKMNKMKKGINIITHLDVYIESQVLKS
jgi:hypothetical protein